MSVGPRLSVSCRICSARPRTTPASPLRCSASPPAPEKRTTPTPRLLTAAVAGVTELLRLVSPPDKQREIPLAQQVPPPRSIDDVLRVLRSDYDRAYFLTGKFTAELYAEDCCFEDPTICFSGVDRYARNLDLLIPFFDSPSIELEKIEKRMDHRDVDFVSAAWRLRTYLKFPWRPLVSIEGSTAYYLDEELKIVRHVESWNVSALESIAHIFTPGSKY